MSANELAVVMSYIASLEQRVKQLEEKDKGRDQHLQVHGDDILNLQRGQLELGTSLQSNCQELRENLDELKYELNTALRSAIEDAHVAKSAQMWDANYCDSAIVADWLEQRLDELE